MIDVEVEAGWLFITGIAVTYIIEWIICFKQLKGYSQIKHTLLGYNISSVATIYLIIILLRGGISPILKLQMDCNGVLALCGVMWISNIFCVVKFIGFIKKSK